MHKCQYQQQCRKQYGGPGFSKCTLKNVAQHRQLPVRYLVSGLVLPLSHRSMLQRLVLC
jgi:hypothetical protein